MLDLDGALGPSTLDKLTAKVKAEKAQAFKKGKGKKGGGTAVKTNGNAKVKREGDENAGGRILRKRKAEEGQKQSAFNKSKQDPEIFDNSDN